MQERGYYQQPNSQNTPYEDSIGSDQLRRAIERNRKKQHKREVLQSRNSKIHNSVSDNNFRPQRTSDLVRSRSLPSSPSFESGRPGSIPRRPRQRDGVRQTQMNFRDGNRVNSSYASNRPLSESRRVGPSNFQRSLSRDPSRLRQQQGMRLPEGYDGLVEKEDISKLKTIWNKYIHRAGWIFGLALLLRLITAKHGIWDFYKMEKLLSQKEVQLRTVLEENKKLTINIKKMAKSKAFQKKILRDNLGVISQDEYLVLFSQRPSQD